ncbi:metallophosphoesterase family protein [Aureimonas sp. AU4]|uniref:metallophosphoesterase family protein n=1 Tax=Aureimonas sp. AU4 TaxID=1638163 RepID=UPI000782F396|nr:metallophosphoesterase family protein [Aureimonas sp. AU4]
MIASPDTIFYAIGDVHGCYDQLRRLEDAILVDGSQFDERKHIVMLGDYVDRGPNSAAVLEHLSSELPPGFERTSLCGNHEQEMLGFLEDPDGHANWLRLGSDATLKSYGIDLEHLLELYGGDLSAVRDVLLDAMPAEHIATLRGLASIAVANDIVFVHAGLRPGFELERQSEEDLLWIRNPFLERGPELPVFVVHGHTPVEKPVFRPGRLGIDTGAFKTGRLTAARIFRRHVHLMHTRRSGDVDVSPDTFVI